LGLGIQPWGHRFLGFRNDGFMTILEDIGGYRWDFQMKVLAHLYPPKWS
jgi:hypothetical protein